MIVKLLNSDIYFNECMFLIGSSHTFLFFGYTIETRPWNAFESWFYVPENVKIKKILVCVKYRGSPLNFILIASNLDFLQNFSDHYFILVNDHHLKQTFCNFFLWFVYLVCAFANMSVAQLSNNYIFAILQEIVLFSIL